MAKPALITSPCRHRLLRRAALCCAFLLWTLASPLCAQEFSGLPLTEALAMLEARGLELVYTSSLVRPEMKVDQEPQAVEPSLVLEQLLRPHGLTAQPGPGGTLMIVPGTAIPATAVVEGILLSRESGEPVANVTVKLLEVDVATQSGPDGAFSLISQNHGELTLETSHPDFLSHRLPVQLQPGQPARLSITLNPSYLSVETIDVVSSHFAQSSGGSSPLLLQRDDLLALPHVGDDVLRTLDLLPGTTSNDRSARFSIRGGRSDEVQVRLDGLEIFEAFHLQDFDSALSLMAPSTLGEIELMTGGFPAEFGDRMSGVLNLSSRDPLPHKRTVLGLSVLNGQVQHSGNFGKVDGGWLASIRGGSLQLALEVAGEAENPGFWDLFGTFHRRFESGHDIRGHVLVSDDQLDFQDTVEGGIERFQTHYVNAYGWLTHAAVLSNNTYVETIGSHSHVDRDRRGLEDLDLGGFDLEDLRRLNVTGLRQIWRGRIGSAHELSAGFELRTLVTEYDYSNNRQLSDPLADIRDQPREGTTSFFSSTHSEHYSLHASDRWSFGSWTLDAGLRFDENTLTSDRHTSPRLNLVRSLGAKTSLRLAWGYFYQSQRAYELQVEDGETSFSSAERAEHRILGIEHSFETGPVGSLRAEIYQRRFRNPRARYENLFLPISISPELEADRVLIAPESGLSEGLELLLRSRPGNRIQWFASYTYSEVTDRLEGRDVRRGIDQPHALRADVGYRDLWGFDVNLAFHFHTGWPTTEITGRLITQPDGTPAVAPVLGPLRGDRLRDYTRTDFRISRTWKLRRGELVTYLEIQNLTNARNIAGFELDFKAQPDGGVEVISSPEFWNGALPTLGATWTF